MERLGDILSRGHLRPMMPRNAPPPPERYSGDGATDADADVYLDEEDMFADMPASSPLLPDILDEEDEAGYLSSPDVRQEEDRPGDQERASTRAYGELITPVQITPVAAPEHQAGQGCPLCGGVGYVRLNVPLGDPSFGKAVACRCKERQLAERRRLDLQQLSSLDAFRDKTFATFDPTVYGVREAFDAAYRYAANPQNWILFSGRSGCGKTHLAAAIANRHLEMGQVTVLFSIVPDLLDHLRKAFAPNSETTYDELFDRVREAALLVLDDLGAENSTPWAAEKLFQIINYRYNYRLPTVITTNYTLMRGVDERILSRLSDISLVRVCHIEAEDYRPRNIARRPRRFVAGQ